MKFIKHSKISTSLSWQEQKIIQILWMLWATIVLSGIMSRRRSKSKVLTENIVRSKVLTAHNPHTRIVALHFLQTLVGSIIINPIKLQLFWSYFHVLYNLKMKNKILKVLKMPSNPKQTFLLLILSPKLCFP